MSKNKRYLVESFIAELDDPYLGSENYRIGAEDVRRKRLQQDQK
jgi:hypothetical protein